MAEDRQVCTQVALAIEDAWKTLEIARFEGIQILLLYFRLLRYLVDRNVAIFSDSPERITQFAERVGTLSQLSVSVFVVMRGFSGQFAGRG